MGISRLLLLYFLDMIFKVVVGFPFEILMASIPGSLYLPVLGQTPLLWPPPSPLLSMLGNGFLF